MRPSASCTRRHAHRGPLKVIHLSHCILLHGKYLLSMLFYSSPSLFSLWASRPPVERKEEEKERNHRKSRKKKSVQETRMEEKLRETKGTKEATSGGPTEAHHVMILARNREGKGKTSAGMRRERETKRERKERYTTNSFFSGTADPSRVERKRCTRRQRKPLYCHSTVRLTAVHFSWWKRRRARGLVDSVAVYVHAEPRAACTTPHVGGLSGETDATCVYR